MHKADYVTEYDVENKFIETILQNKWYTYSSISTYEELVDNFRDKLNLLNKDRLNGIKLSDEEFRSVLLYLENKSVFELSQILRGGKIDVFKRDGREVYLKLVELDMNHIDDNYFEVAHQITTIGTTENKFVGRFDVTLLINGIPFVQIELKKPGVEIYKAFNQVLRYKADGNYRGLFKFIQIFVISNEIHTLYFANNDQKILKSNCFVWRDMERERVDQLYDFEEEFLFCPGLFKIVFKCMITSYQEKKLFVMRPYQIYAYSALYNACIKRNENGYCFHSTGSGKTLTSFKFACAMAEKPEIDKVFFLVDRKDLDDKTIDDFTMYTSTSSSDFTNIKTTKDLVDMIDSNQDLIVATINKMSNALKNPKYLATLKPYFDKKVVFMFDECHRSQAGEMRRIIQKSFTNALYYGFTGTPIFTERDEIEENSKLTKIYFGDPVDIYTLKDAIADGNVLPLCIDYVNTIKLKNGIKEDLDKDVQAIDSKEVLLDDRRIDVVYHDVIDHFDNKTVGRKYNAIFACQSISLLLKYYKRFKQNDVNLKIAAIYSYDPNEDRDEDDDISENSAKEELAKIINDYNELNGSHFDISNYAGYERNVIKDFRNKELNILFVVDKCLTGMDFVKCNTLYLDKSLKMHRLIQAMSRTIRTNETSKICGNIICYQTSRKAVDEALAHFNNDVDVYNDVTLEPLPTLISRLNEYFIKCNDERDLANSPSEVDKKKYIEDFRDLMRTFNKAKNYSDFDIEQTEVDMKTYNELQSLYKDIYNERPTIFKESILNDIDFEIELLDEVKVDFDYLIRLLRDYQKDSPEEREATKNKINRVLDSVPSKTKQELLLKFVSSFMDQNIENLYEGNVVDPFDQYREFIQQQKDEDINKMVEEYGVDKEGLKTVIEEYAFYQDETELNRAVTTLYASNIDLPILERLKKINDLIISIEAYFDKFDDITFN